MRYLQSWPKYLPLALLMIFGILVTNGIHGYSISVWHNYIDASTPSEIIKGSAKTIRSDDWLLDLPIALAQTTHEPKFQIENKNIGLGTNILSPIKAPALSGITIFRPSVLGFFLGADQGLAWMWWFMWLGLFYTFFELFKIISNGKNWLSVTGAATLSISPYFQIWSFHKAEILIGAALIFISFTKMLKAEKPTSTLLWGALLGWAAGMMVFNFMYPPILVVTALFLLFLIAGFIFDELKTNRILNSECVFKNIKWKIAGLSIAIIVIGLAIFFILFDSYDAFTAIRNTSYPGKRVSTGGGLPIWAIFVDHFSFRRAAVNGAGWGPLGNECEAASFLFFAPMVLPFYLFRAVKNKGSINYLILSMSIFSIYLLVYLNVGVPIWLSKITLLSNSTANRVVIGLGIANFIILIKFLSDFKDGLFEKLDNVKYVYFISTGLTLYLMYEIKNALPGYKLNFLVLGFILQSILTLLLYSKKYGANWFFTIQFLVLATYTLNFNPIAKGGFEYILDNPLSKKITAIQQKGTGSARWLVMPALDNANSTALVLNNYLRMINIPSIGGYQCPPQKEMWNIIAKDNPANWEITNQCAFVVFYPSDKKWTVNAESPGVFRVYGPPTDEKLDQLNVKYILTEGSAEDLKIHFENSKLKLLDTYQNKRIYERLAPAH